jgi:hypothetical protein
LSKVKIISLPDCGALKLWGVDVSIGEEIEVGDLNHLTYAPPENGWTGKISFSWKGADEVNYSANTAEVNVTISLSATSGWPEWATATSIGGGAAVAITSGILCYKYRNNIKNTLLGKAILKMVEGIQNIGNEEPGQLPMQANQEPGQQLIIPVNQEPGQQQPIIQEPGQLPVNKGV